MVCSAWRHAAAHYGSKCAVDTVACVGEHKEKVSLPSTLSKRT